MPVLTAKVPVVLAVGLVCFLLGGGLVGVVMSYTLVKPDQPVAAANADDEGDAKGSKAGPPGGMPKGMGMPKGGMPKGGGMPGGGMPGGGGQRGPTSKTQLAQLVGKLDTLTKKPLAVEMTAEQKKQAKELLAGLDTAEDLKEEDAKAKLDALLKLVEGNKESLEAAGYRWPGSGGGSGGGGGGGPPPANPFKAGEGAERLKSLQTTLAKE